VKETDSSWGKSPASLIFLDAPAPEQRDCTGAKYALIIICSIAEAAVGVFGAVVGRRSSDASSAIRHWRPWRWLARRARARHAWWVLPLEAWIPWVVTVHYQYWLGYIWLTDLVHACSCHHSHSLCEAVWGMVGGRHWLVWMQWRPTGRSVSASVNLPLHHKVQKFSSGTGSLRWSQKKGHKMVVVYVKRVCYF